MEITIIHRIAEKQRDDSRNVEERVVHTSPLTARGLAKVARKLTEEVEYYRKVFGPGIISPKHTFRVEINGKPLYDTNDIYRWPTGFDSYGSRHETWSEVAARLAKEYG